MKENNRKKNTLIIVLAIVLLTLIISHVTIVTNLIPISSTGIISPDIVVDFKNIDYIGNIATNTKNHANFMRESGNNLRLYFDAQFEKPGDYIEYNITLVNNSEVPITLKYFKVDDFNVLEKDGIQFFFSGLENNDIIKPKEERKIVIRAEWDENATTYPSITYKEYDISLIFVQK